MTHTVEYGCLDCAAQFTARPEVLSGGVTRKPACPDCGRRNTLPLSPEAGAAGGDSPCCGPGGCCG